MLQTVTSIDFFQTNLFYAGKGIALVTACKKNVNVFL